MKFNYAPLVDPTVTIRVLVVEPGGWDEPIICSLRHVDLQDEPHYEAISYCWGGSVKSQAVILHGSPLAVTKNAHGALRNFRREYGQSQRNLWIGSICIDQANEAEKAHQVAIMGDIYRKSAHTLVWLGEDDGTIADAVKTLRSLVREMEEQTQGFEWSRMDAMNVDIIGAGASGSHQWPYPACVGEVVNLYERPWFSRLWVVQEVILSPVSTFVSGENEVDWPEVGKAATWLLYKAGGNGKCDVPPERRAGLWNASGMWKKFDVEHGMNAKNPAPQLERLSLCELVWNTLRFNVSEPKDRIFAVLGLTKWSATNMALPEAVRPDYSKNLYSVYRDAIKVEIAERKELGILEGGIVDQQSIFSCEKIQTPTWVHRWDKMETEEDPDQLAWWLFKASGEKTEISVSWFQIPQSLLVRGAKVDHIRMVSDTIRRSDFQSVEKQRDLLSSLWLYVKQGSKDCESESVFTFSLILVGGSVNRRRAEKYPNHSRNFAAYLDWLGLCPWIGTIHHPVKLDASGDPKEFEDAMVYALRNRRLFVTREGYIGIGSQLIQENDLVCVLQGANMPYILRPNEPYYHFLWTCYVPGIMDGETDAFRKMLFDIR